ncbi:MAG: hypothetical protein WKG01_25855 [Kofleriaceae bacterium]
MTPKEGELPPLPPASGTAVGYLVDGAAQLKLRDDQIKKLKDIDSSLAARNDGIDTQIRSIERPNDEGGDPNKPHNNAPGAAIKTTPGSAKLHEAKAVNDREALTKAFALLDPAQQEAARKLLDERGIAAPGGPKPKQTERGSDDGQPLPEVPLEP